jgi:hypothetical protein
MKHIRLFEDLDEYEKEYSDPAGFAPGAKIIFHLAYKDKNLKGTIISITDDKIVVKDEIGDKHDIKRNDIVYPPFFKKTQYQEQEPGKEPVQAVEENAMAGEKSEALAAATTLQDYLYKLKDGRSEVEKKLFVNLGEFIEEMEKNL